METDLLALVEQDGFRTVQKSTSRGGQYNGPCPFCGGRDRFRVQPNYGEYGFFACNQCQRSGSAVNYLMLRRGYSKHEALALVGWKPGDGSTPTTVVPQAALDERPRWKEPAEAWQEAATVFYRSCQRTLWSPQGRTALDYLRGRGLTDETINKATLGYHPCEAYGPVREWGKAIWLPRGIVFPWFKAEQSAIKVWRLTIRDETVANGAGRYQQVKGGSNGLYLVDSLRLKRPAVIMTEGELDALSVAQSCGDLVAVVATGTTAGSHTPYWVSLLAQHERVLIAFDAEEQGDTAALWWLKRLKNAHRLRPLWKDANQMLQDGADLRVWISTALPDSHDTGEQVQQAKQNQIVSEASTSARVRRSARFSTRHVLPSELRSVEEVCRPDPCSPFPSFDSQPEPYRSYAIAHARLNLPSGIPLLADTPQGRGIVWRWWVNQVGVVLFTDDEHVTFFKRLEDVQRIRLVLDEVLVQAPDWCRIA